MVNTNRRSFLFGVIVGIAATCTLLLAGLTYLYVRGSAMVIEDQAKDARLANEREAHQKALCSEAAARVNAISRELDPIIERYTANDFGQLAPQDVLERLDTAKKATSECAIAQSYVAVPPVALGKSKFWLSSQALSGMHVMLQGMHSSKCDLGCKKSLFKELKRFRNDLGTAWQT